MNYWKEVSTVADIPSLVLLVVAPYFVCHYLICQYNLFNTVLEQGELLVNYGLK